MTIRSWRETTTFRHSFRIRGIERLLPEGASEVVTDEEKVEGLSSGLAPRCHHDYRPRRRRVRLNGAAVDRIRRPSGCLTLGCECR